MLKSQTIQRLTWHPRRRQRGVALIIVVGTLAVLAFMVMHLTVISQLVSAEAKVAASRTYLAYAAESAADRAFWMLLQDRRRFGNRTLGVAAAERAAQGKAEEAWMMDSRPHSLMVGEYPASVKLADADSGLDFSGANPSSNLRVALQSDDLQQNDTVERFLDVLTDYLDPDDTKRLHGKEVSDYASEGWPDLPRNNPVQCREEIYWLDGLFDAVSFKGGDTAGADAGGIDQDAVRIIPPPGRSFPRSQRPSFFSASPALLKSLTPLTQAELPIVLAARQQWEDSGAIISEVLDAALYQRLSSKFSFQESGVVTVKAVATTPDGEIRRELSITRDCRNLRGNLSPPALVYWERLYP